jgi:anti-sigma factor RsiW
MDAARAESELAGLFDGLLARGREDEESPGYELLEAAVDGTLDPVEAELFSSRLAGDPVLQREFDDLVALRNQLLPRANTATSAAAARRPAASRWLGFAAAAVLLAALGLGLRPEHRPTTAGLAGGPEAATGPSQVVFVDSFEGGTTRHWSN